MFVGLTWEAPPLLGVDAKETLNAESQYVYFWPKVAGGSIAWRGAIESLVPFKIARP